VTTTFGVTAAGFVAPTVQELIAQFQTDQLAGVSSTLDVSADSVIGQLNGIYAFYLAQAWEALAGGYDGFDPDKAENVMLTMLSKLTGTPRAAATQSTVACIVGADIGTTLLAGTHFASVTSKPDVKFTPKVDFIAAAGSTPDVIFVSENTGPIQAPNNQLTVIATPVVGWTSINNPHDALPGALVATDSQLRITRQRELTRAGSSTIDAVFAKLVVLLGSVPGASVAPFNNVTDSLDVNGLPPHSFEMVVWDPSGSIDDDTFAQTIWDNKPAGIRSYGESSGTAIDRTGATQLVAFSKATPVPIYIDYTLVPRVTFIGDPAFKIAVALACSEGIVATESTGVLTTLLDPFATGVPVTLYDLTVATQGLGARVSICTFGVTPSPVSSTDVAIGVRQIATFDTSRITVTP
jgi:hypothetical protein